MNDHARVLITAGPTFEPIDRVRYIGNRSSGRMGIALAEAAIERGLPATLLLGPVGAPCPDDSRVRVLRFQTTADLQALLRREWPEHNLLIMAAAVSDYRPRHASDTQKLRRSDRGIVLELEATPDLLAEAARSRRSGQFIVGFALEPAEELIDAARRKLARKGIDAIVANPLETMDSEKIEGTLILASGETLQSSPTTISKEDFARWLLDHLLPRLAPTNEPLV